MKCAAAVEEDELMDGICESTVAWSIWNGSCAGVFNGKLPDAIKVIEASKKAIRELELLRSSDYELRIGGEEFLLQEGYGMSEGSGSPVCGEEVLLQGNLNAGRCTGIEEIQSEHECAAGWLTIKDARGCQGFFASGMVLQGRTGAYSSSIADSILHHAGWRSGDGTVWKRPHGEAIKINLDGAFDQQSKKAAIGVVARDNKLMWSMDVPKASMSFLNLKRWLCKRRCCW